MSVEDEWSRNTAFGLEAATPETTVTNTTIWGIDGEEVSRLRSKMLRTHHICSVITRNFC